MSELMDMLVVGSISLGVFFFVAGTLGLLRFPDPLTRLHALTKADNLGLGLVVLGLMLRASGPLEILKLLGVWVILLMASTTVAQMLARVARDEMQELEARKK